MTWPQGLDFEFAFAGAQGDLPASPVQPARRAWRDEDAVGKSVFVRLAGQIVAQ
jgi:hypothetical protein